MLFSLDFFQLITLAVTFVISITLHEYAHAYTSDKLGDPTPRLQGRLTPNPLVHIDPIGFVLIFLIQFGWGRPVQIDPSYYRHRLRDELLVALAGPAVNVALGTLAAGIVVALMHLQGPEGLYVGDNLLIQFWYMFGWINMGLAVFNLIPVPPLDGYRIVKYLSPQTGYWLEKNGRVIGLVLLGLLLIPTPIQSILQSIIISGAQLLYGIAHAFRGILFLGV